MKYYVLGFLHDNYEVVLIHKNRPTWQKGLLNGVGGHIEDGERPLTAMQREFKEETGHEHKHWFHFCTMQFQEAVVYCYIAQGDVRACITVTDEAVVRVSLDTLSWHETVDNVPWLVAMGRSMDRLGGTKWGHCHVNYTHGSNNACECSGS